MATVCKCDRCKRYVDRPVISCIQGRVDPLRQVASSKDIRMDLCPECYASLRKFLGYNDQTEKEEE